MKCWFKYRLRLQQETQYTNNLIFIIVVYRMFNGYLNPQVTKVFHVVLSGHLTHVEA